jgi:hypothetical protein
MSSTTHSVPPASVELQASTPAAAAERKIHTAQLVAAMLKSSPQVSDLIFSPGRAPHSNTKGWNPSHLRTHFS